MDFVLVGAVFFDFISAHPGWALAIAVLFMAFAALSIFTIKTIMKLPLFLLFSFLLIAAFYFGIRVNLGQPNRYLPDGEFLLLYADIDAGVAYVLVRPKITEKGSGGSRFYFGKPQLLELPIEKGSAKEKELRDRLLQMKKGKGAILKFKRKRGDPYAQPEEFIIRDFRPPELPPK